MIVLLLTEFRVNRAINRRDIAKKRFSIWQAFAILDFSVTTSYFIRVLCITFLTLLNFHLDWFSTF